MPETEVRSMGRAENHQTEEMSGQAWETLVAAPEFAVERSGRFLRAELRLPHRVISTSVRNGGQRTGLRWLVNHQSCEGKDHRERHLIIRQMGEENYHNHVCGEIGIEPDLAAVMGTAANMHYTSIVTHEDAGVRATAIVTAGVQGNAACGGDPANWRESDGGWEEIAKVAGTINTFLLINSPLTEGALARAVVTMTEGKSAALQRLAIGSLYSRDIATGTGTDQFCIAAAENGGPRFTSTSPHVKLGELIGLATRDATLEALRWQNGLEPSYTRSVFHALCRFGFSEAKFYQVAATRMESRPLELLRLNDKSVFFEPLVSASAYALAAVLDRVQYGTLPADLAKEAVRRQGACLAAALAAKPAQWAQFCQALPEPDPSEPAPFIAAAICLGWLSKWN